MLEQHSNSNQKIIVFLDINMPTLMVGIFRKLRNVILQPASTFNLLFLHPLMKGYFKRQVSMILSSILISLVLFL
jgi:hypothetical protein